MPNICFPLYNKITCGLSWSLASARFQREHWSLTCSELFHPEAKGLALGIIPVPVNLELLTTHWGRGWHLPYYGSCLTEGSSPEKWVTASSSWSTHSTQGGSGGMPQLVTRDLGGEPREFTVFQNCPIAKSAGSMNVTLQTEYLKVKLASANTFSFLFLFYFIIYLFILEAALDKN